MAGPAAATPAGAASPRSPCPGGCEWRSLPRCRETMARTRARPSPLPSAVMEALPRYSSSPRWAMSSSRIPGPVSATSTATQAPSSKARISMVSPAAENLSALSSRLWRARKRRSRSPETGGSGQGASGRVSDMRAVAPSGRARAICSSSFSRPARSTGSVSSGCVSISVILRRSPLSRASRSTWVRRLASVASSQVSPRLARAARMAVSGFLISWSRRRMKRRWASACSPPARDTASSTRRRALAWSARKHGAGRPRRRPPASEHQGAGVGPQVEDGVGRQAGLEGGGQRQSGRQGKRRGCQGQAAGQRLPSTRPRKR